MPDRCCRRLRSPWAIRENTFSRPTTEISAIHASAASTVDRTLHTRATSSLDQISWLRLTGRVNIRYHSSVIRFL